MEQYINQFIKKRQISILQKHTWILKSELLIIRAFKVKDIRYLMKIIANSWKNNLIMYKRHQILLILPYVTNFTGLYVLLVKEHFKIERCLVFLTII